MSLHSTSAYEVLENPYQTICNAAQQFLAEHPDCSLQSVHVSPGLTSVEHVVVTTEHGTYTIPVATWSLVGDKLQPGTFLFTYGCGELESMGMTHNTSEQGQGLVEYAFILMTAFAVVCIFLVAIYGLFFVFSGPAIDLLANLIDGLKVGDSRSIAQAICFSFCCCIVPMGYLGLSLVSSSRRSR